jgi:hypothetical protein
VLVHKTGLYVTELVAQKTGKIMLLHTSNFAFLYSGMADRNFLHRATTLSDN